MDDKPPTSLKPVQPYLLVGKQFSKRDPIITYYALMYAVQEGIKLSKNDSEAKTYVIGLMDQLDQLKKGQLKDEEAIGSDVVAQSHIEDAALKLFRFADTRDRESDFSKAVVKSFLTSSQLFTILKQFGELTEDVEGKMKYAKWKAVEISKCQKNGITPTPGPPGGMGSEDGATGYDPAPSMYPPSQPGDASTSYYSMGDKPVPKPRHMVRPDYPDDSEASSTPPQDPGYGFSFQPQPPMPGGIGGVAMGGAMAAVGGGGEGVTSVNPETTAKAQKLCKFASSALDYEDVTGAVEYLQEALVLLTTAKH